MHIEALADSFTEFCPTPDALRIPDGYRDSGLALIDAIFSIRAHYTGARNVVRRYAEFAGVQVVPLDPVSGSRDRHGIPDVLTNLAGVDPTRAANDILDNRSRSGGRLKAALVVTAATRLLEKNCRTREDVALDDSAASYTEQKRAWTDITGLGWVTFEYFRLLCGAETVKPDVMVLRWIDRITDSRPSPRQGLATMRALASELAVRWQVQHVSLRSLDQTVWWHESGRSS